VSAAAVFDRLFGQAAAGQPAAVTVRHPSGGVHRFDPAGWCRDALPGDDALLERCTGPTLDVGCGPGRLTAAVLAAGHTALGIDVSATAVRLARGRGAIALRRDVFGAVPGAGRWEHLLLADGNIGIGGDPRRLLRRCAQLVRPGGMLHAELGPPGSATWRGTAAVRHTGGRSTRLPWATVAAEDLPGLATAAGLTVVDTGAREGRWFATLRRR
jgi:SAM-dependent methyltransferase